MDQRKIKILLITITVILIGTVLGSLYSINKHKAPEPEPILTKPAQREPIAAKEILQSLPPAPPEETSEIEKQAQELSDKLPPPTVSTETNANQKNAKNTITPQELSKSLPSPK